MVVAWRADDAEDDMMKKTLSDWETLAEKELRAAPDTLTWHTPEGIDVKPLYTAADLDGTDADSLPGFAPFMSSA